MLSNLLPRVLHSDSFEEPLVVSSTSSPVSSASPAIVPATVPIAVVTVLVASLPVIVVFLIVSIIVVIVAVIVVVLVLVLVPIVSPTVIAIIVASRWFLWTLRESTKHVVWVDVHFVFSQRVLAGFWHGKGIVEATIYVSKRSQIQGNGTYHLREIHLA